MNSEHTVSIITRTKNRNLLLDRAVQSVLAQTHPNWRHVIVNDGGDPNPVNDLVARYDGPYRDRVTVIHHERSKGMEAASNAGIMSSDGKYVVIHDDDDSWHPDFLRRSLNQLEQSAYPSVKGVVTHITQIFERLEHGSVIEERRQDFDPNLTAISLPQISEINRFLPIAFLFERCVFDEIGMFDESLPVIGDWEFNIRYFMKYDVIVLKENLANYHVRTNSVKGYSNTVTAGQDSHIFHRALIVNKHMREDISEGRLTKGMILAEGDYFHRIGGGIWRISNILDKLKALPFINFFRRIVKK